MNLHDFRLEDEFIELNVLLKLLALASSGGGAKALIASGAVRVNGVSETRTRRKLRAGDLVQVDDESIRMVAGE